MFFGSISGGSTISALEVRRQKEEELRKNDHYWQERLKQQEQDLKKTAAILEKEYNETVRPKTFELFQKFELFFTKLLNVCVFFSFSSSKCVNILIIQRRSINCHNAKI